MLTSHALLAPVLPTLLMDQHRQHFTEMLVALGEASQRLYAESPAAVVVLSARWSAPGPFRVDPGRRHATLTDYAGLGVEVRHDCAGRPALARALVAAGMRDGVHVATATRGVDSGVTVPMHFLAARPRLAVVPLSLPPRPAAECRAWGGSIRRVLEAWPEPVAFVVGGALSRNEHAWNLKREVPEARAFDEWALGALQRGAFFARPADGGDRVPMGHEQRNGASTDYARCTRNKYAHVLIRMRRNLSALGFEHDSHRLSRNRAPRRRARRSGGEARW